MANEVFGALAHPTRRAIVERISAGASSVGEASAGIGVSKPTISRHLRILEEAGVVTRVIDGRTHRIALNTRRLGDASEWIDQQRARWERVFDAVEGYLENQKEST
jgi:DNA-binding transcriptional ArsR family regulator